MGVEDALLPTDERTVIRSQTVGVAQDVEFRYTMTAEQAEDLLVELDAMALETNLNDDQKRLKAACLARLLEDVRPAEDRDPAERSVAEQHKETLDYINTMRARKNRGA